MRKTSLLNDKPYIGGAPWFFKIGFSLITLAALLLYEPTAHAVTEQELQKILANDKTIQNLDKHLNLAYGKLMKLLPPDEKLNLQREQKAWLKERAALSEGSELESSYRTRVEELYQRELMREIKIWMGNVPVTDFDREACEGPQGVCLDPQILEKERPLVAKVYVDDFSINEENAAKALKGCPTFFCRTYDLYFRAQQYPNDKERQEKLGEELNTLWYCTGQYFREDAFTPTLLDLIANLGMFSGASFSKQYNYYGVPLWLVLKHPEIWEAQNYGSGDYPYATRVDTKLSLEHLPIFEELNDLLLKIVGEDVANPMSLGTYFWRTLAQQRSMALSRMAIAPEKYEDTVDLATTILKPWSFEGPWNLRKYKELQELFNQAALVLQKHYASYKPLEAYAPYARQNLSRYISEWIFKQSTPASDKAYAVFSQPKLDLSALKEKTINFQKDDWNAALCYAILNDYGVDILEWIISSGADVNAIVNEETPLIKAADHPDILKFLIQKGAKLEGQNGFKKTALFYAVQFNNFESVKVLVEAGANVNAHLADNTDNENFFIEEVLNFTPLAYSKRYGSPEMTEYLIKHGATLQDVPKEVVERWSDADILRKMRGIFSYNKQIPTVRELKERTNNFTQKEWDAALYCVIDQFNYGEDVWEWLLASGANVRANVEGSTPLAAAVSHPKAFAFLLKKGVQLQKTDDLWGRAIGSRDLESVKLLVEGGVDFQNPVQKIEGFEITPLAYSMSHGTVEITAYLVKQGATLKNIPLDKLKTWVGDDKKYDEHMVLISHAS